MASNRRQLHLLDDRWQVNYKGAEWRFQSFVNRLLPFPLPLLPSPPPPRLFARSRLFFFLALSPTREPVHRLPVEECSLLLYAIKQVPRCWSEVSGSLSTFAISRLLSVLLAFSTCPLPAGWYAVVRDFLIFSIWHRTLNSRDSKLRPWSVWMASGTQYGQTQLSTSALAQVLALWIGKAHASTHLEGHDVTITTLGSRQGTDDVNVHSLHRVGWRNGVKRCLRSLPRQFTLSTRQTGRAL